MPCNPKKPLSTTSFLSWPDDLGPGELSCYGCTEINTPHIDQLSKEGMQFNIAYTTPVCMPSRVLGMTGRYGFRTGYWNMGERPGGPNSVDPTLNFIENEPIFGQLLQKEGYLHLPASGSFPVLRLTGYHSPGLMNTVSGRDTLRDSGHFRKVRADDSARPVLDIFIPQLSRTVK